LLSGFACISHLPQVLYMLHAYHPLSFDGPRDSAVGIATSGVRFPEREIHITILRDDNIQFGRYVRAYRRSILLQSSG
jgi:hypothetical protein